jgi:hypothetical protein
MIMTAFFLARSALENQVVLSVIRILNGGGVGNRLNGGRDVESLWATALKAAIVINKIQARFFIIQRNNFLPFLHRN